MKSLENPEKTVIESHFPFSTVSEIAYRESNAKRYYRPVLTLHKWFARRLGSVFRSILIYAAKTPSIEEKNFDFASADVFWKEYLQEHDFHDLSILDPFMGGGTTIIESIRLGFGKVIGGDLNPVAWFTVKKELDEVNLEDIKNEFNKLSIKLESELLNYYKTRCGHCLQQADVMYFFWVKEIQCERCAETLPLFRSYLFAHKRKDDTEAYYICPKCEIVFQAKTQKPLQCPKCEHNFEKKNHVVKRGKYYCTHCDHTGKIVDANIKQGRPSERLYAIEYYCPSCKTRDYKRADTEDFELYQQASHQLESIQDQLPLPQQKIPMGAKTQELLNHQILSFMEMFNARQLLCLGKLLREILQIPDQNVREFFLITFSTALEYNNLLCEYHRKNHYIYNLFRKHAFPATLNPVENNVWGTKLGTGTFKNFFAKTIRIKEFCQNPYEYYIAKNGEAKRQPMIRPIVAKTVSSYPALLNIPSENVYLYCSSSHQIQIPDNCVDLVITDPPYYDNVQYAELSDFYYVWLRIGLKDYYPWFEAPLTPKKAEIVKNVKIGKTSDDYQQGLNEIFSEISRVLRTDGLLIFTFHHKQLKAWASIIQSILDNKFYMTAVYPVRAEMETSTQIRGKKSIEFDVIFVCRKRLRDPEPIMWENLQSSIKDSVENKLLSLSSNGEELSKEDKFVIQLGVGLKYYTQHYPLVSFKKRAFLLIEALENLAAIFK